MRYYELYEDINPLDIARNDIMDYIIPLKDKGMTSITVNQLIDYLNTDNDLSSINIDRDFIEQAIKPIDNFSLMTNSSGILCLIFGESDTNDIPKNSSQDKVDDMATDSALRDIKD